MANVTFSPGIEYVQGSLAKPKKENGHRHGDYLIGTHRTAPTTNNNCTRIYIRKADTYVRSTEPSAEEVAARERFAAVSRAVNTRMQDLTKVAQDTAAFKAQKDSANGKKTMRSYLWSLEKAAYDETHQGG